MTKEATTFYDYVARLALDGNDVPAEHLPRLKGLMSRVVETLQDTIDIIDFWKKPIEVKKLRAQEVPQLVGPDLGQSHEHDGIIYVMICQVVRFRLFR